jgi:GH18 family chitinase
MTYDFHGSWDQNRAHHSSLNSKDNEKDDTMYIVRKFIQSFVFFVIHLYFI